MDLPSENQVSGDTQNNEEQVTNVPFPKPKKNVKEQVENIEEQVVKKKKPISNGEEKDVEPMEVVDIRDKPTHTDQKESLYAAGSGGPSTLQNNSN
jgi:hypothetical protein